MAQGSELDYILLPLFIASTFSVLNLRNNDLRSFGHAIAFLFIQQIGNVAEFIQHIKINLVNMGWT